MKKGEILSLIPIKCDEKTTTDELKELHYEINEILYNWRMRYISPLLATMLSTRLTKYGKKINALEIKNDKAEPKRKEILSKLKPIILSLRDYSKKYQPQPNDNKEVEMMLKYQVAQYLKIKNAITEDEILKYLKINKTIAKAYNIKAVDNKKFIEMQNELQQMLTQKYAIQIS